MTALTRKLSKSTLARNTMWMFSGQGLRLLEQGAYFLIIAKGLGVREYGAFVSVLALASIIGPFSCWGTGALLIKHVSRRPEQFREWWGNALFANFVVGSIFTVGVALISRVALPHNFPFALILTVAVSELICRGITNTAGQAFQAFERMSQTAKIPVLVTSLKLVGAIVMVLLFARPTALVWSCFYAGASVLTMAISIALVNRKLGTPRLALWRLKPELMEGFYFSLSQSSQTVYNDIDKTMLARLSTLEATGLYAAAYRLIDMSFLPVRSLLNAAYPRFFRYGSAGIQGSIRYARRLVAGAVAYGIVAALMLFVVAPLLPHILGGDYARSVNALRWLAPLVVLKAFHYFAADSLTGAGFQKFRTSIQAGVAIFNVLINLWIIPAFSWRGAAWSSLASDGMLALALWMLVAHLWRRQNESEALRTADLNLVAP